MKQFSKFLSNTRAGSLGPKNFRARVKYYYVTKNVYCCTPLSAAPSPPPPKVASRSLRITVYCVDAVFNIEHMPVCFHWLKIRFCRNAFEIHFIIRVHDGLNLLNQFHLPVLYENIIDLRSEICSKKNMGLKDGETTAKRVC